MQEDRGPEDKLLANTATEITGQWFLGLKLLDEGMQQGLSEESRAEWQRLIPVIVGSFQIARELIQRVTFSDQANLDRVCSAGLALPLRFLRPFGDVAASLQLKCALQAAQLLFGQKGKQTQDTVAAAVASPTRFLAPSFAVHLSILQTAAANFIGENQYRSCYRC
jgi:hypothetical protein